MNTEISKVMAEMRERFRIGSALPSYGQIQGWLDRIERALQQPASATVTKLVEAAKTVRDNFRCVLSVNCNCDDEYIDAQTLGIDTALAAYDAQQPTSADVEREARELLAVEYEKAGCSAEAHSLRESKAGFAIQYQAAIDAITAALRKPQQEAPVAYISEEMLARMRTDEIAGTMAHSRPEYCAYGTPVAVYTAPQPRIDLSKFKKLADECDGIEGLGSAVIAIRLRAMIAEQENGNG